MSSSSDVCESPAVLVVDAAYPPDFSLLETPTQTKTQSRIAPAPHSSTTHSSIVDPDHYVFKLKFENCDEFIEMIISHLTKFLDLPGGELETLRSLVKSDMKPCKAMRKPWGFMKKKELKGVIFGTVATDESLIQIQNLMDFLASHLGIEGIFRIPGNSNRMLQLRAALNTGVCIDLKTSKFQSHDVACILKTYLGELPEPLLLHKYFKAHLQVANIMTFDVKGNKTNLPDKMRRIEALQLLLLLLPTVNRTLLRGVLDLLYRTAKNQAVNKMNALNLATMFCPHLLWPRNLKTAELQRNIGRLNDHVAFMIRHSQKIFAAPPYIRDVARARFNCSSPPSASEYRSVICTPSGAIKRTSSGRNELAMEDSTRSYTENALKELFEQIDNMPNSSKKKKIVKNMEKHLQASTPRKKRHKRSRTFGGIIKKKVLSVATPLDKAGSDSKDREDSYVHIPQPGSGTLLRSRPVLGRRKSASTKKPDSRSSIKDNFFRRSIKGERRQVDVVEKSSKSTAPAAGPIPFPSFEDEKDKENLKSETSL